MMLLCLAQTLALAQPTSGSFLGHSRLGLADPGRAASVVTARHVLMQLPEPGLCKKIQRKFCSRIFMCKLKTDKQ